ncbi:MAG: hypothetical protein ABH859_07325 [Pseudomonadota bacterium]
MKDRIEADLNSMVVDTSDAYKVCQIKYDWQVLIFLVLPSSELAKALVYA